MAGNNLQDLESGSLASRIEALENRIAERQHLISVRRSLLTHHIRQQMTSPAVLLLAGGVGFIIGDLTRRGEKNPSESGDAPTTSPFMEVIDNVVAWIRPLFLAEMGKVMQSFSFVASNQLSDYVSRFTEKSAVSSNEDV